MVQFVGIVTNLRPGEFAAHGAEEQRVLAELRAEGVVRQVFRRHDGEGLLAILDADSREALRGELQRLPLTRHHLVEWTLLDVDEL